MMLYLLRHADAGLARIFHTDLLQSSGSQIDGAPKLEVFLGQDETYSRRQTSSLALPHQASQPPHNDQYEISGLNIPYNDSERHLTVLGRSQATAMGAFCHKFQVKPQIILTSPFSRALETMYLVQQKIDMPPCLTLDWISSGMSPEVAIEELAAYSKFESVMLVGHEPDLSHLISSLLGMTYAGNVDIPKASLTAIHLEKCALGAGRLRFLIPVAFIEAHYCFYFYETSFAY